MTGTEMASGLYERLSSPPSDDVEAPMLGGEEENMEWGAMRNLDIFLSRYCLKHSLHSIIRGTMWTFQDRCSPFRVYRYWHGRGLTSIWFSGLLNVLALAFTIAFSTFLLLFVNWSALHSECIVNDTCDIASAAVYSQARH